MLRRLIVSTALLLGILSYLNTTAFCQASGTNNNCGCDYFPMCDYTAKKKFGQETYYGIKGSERKGTYYNCKNGIVSVKWFTQDEYLAERQWQWRSDINDYGYVDYYDTDTKINTKVLYQFNLPVGGEWKISTGEGDFENVYKIESKNYSIAVDGKKYTNVLKLSVITKAKITEDAYIEQQDSYSLTTKRYFYLNTFYDKGEVFKNSFNYYFDKTLGLIKEENTWAELKRNHVSRIDGVTSADDAQLYAFKVRYKMEKERIADSIESLNPAKPTHSFTGTLIQHEWTGEGKSYVFLEDGVAISALYSKTYDSKTKNTDIRVRDYVKGKWKIIDCGDCSSDINVIVQINWYGRLPTGEDTHAVIGQSKFYIMFNGREYYFREEGSYRFAKALSKDLKKALDDSILLKK